MVLSEDKLTVLNAVKDNIYGRNIQITDKGLEKIAQNDSAEKLILVVV